MRKFVMTDEGKFQKKFTPGWLVGGFFNVKIFLNKGLRVGLCNGVSLVITRLKKKNFDF
jgi:hypothetical protein